MQTYLLRSWILERRVYSIQHREVDKVTYFECLPQCFNHARDKLPDTYTVDDVAIHVLKTESHSSPDGSSKEQALAWFKFFKWIKEEE